MPFKLFTLEDGRQVYVDPDAVTAVYDKERATTGGWRPAVDAARYPDAPMNHIGEVWVEEPSPATAVVAIAQTNLVVPYTAAQVLEILDDR